MAKSFGARGQRFRDRLVSRRGFLEGLPLEVDDAPSPVRSVRGGEREDVHDVIRRVVTRDHATGGPTITSRPAAASERMIGHEGSNSERRTLNFADRG